MRILLALVCDQLIRSCKEWRLCMDNQPKEGRWDARLSMGERGQLPDTGFGVVWHTLLAGVRAWARTSAGATYCSSSTVSEGSCLLMRLNTW